MSKQVNVAAAVLTRPDGSVLLGQRAAGTFYPGYWEFPGGKVEAGETPREALIRELREELGIEVRQAHPWLMREHIYEHAHVRLHFFEVPDWHGTLSDHVHAALAWQDPHRFDVGPMLPANGPILKSLRLPRAMAITCTTALGLDAQLIAIDMAVKNGCRLIQVREKTMDLSELTRFVELIRQRSHGTGTLVFVNTAPAFAIKAGADGVHLDSISLMKTRTRPELEWIGASCHTRAELERAAELGLDYALLGSVKETTSHPGQTGLGWDAFATLAAELPLPVFALGGLAPSDMNEARTRGAHGIAAIRGLWQSG